MAKVICDGIASGKSLRTVCGVDAMPSKKTVLKWLDRYPEFRTQYAQARAQQLEHWAEETLDISDDDKNDKLAVRLPDGRVTQVANTAAVQRARLRVDTRKWLLSKLLPKRYGDLVRAELTGADGGPIQHSHDLSGLSDEDLTGLEQLVGKVATLRPNGAG